jgi:hypothetical protein
MKKPSNLNLKEKTAIKRNKEVPTSFERRKKNYAEIKELREMLKQKAKDNAENVKSFF